MPSLARFYQPSLDNELKLLDQSQLDLILVEGFKTEQFPKIELHRSSLNKPLLYPGDNNIIAIATDIEMSLPENIILLDINRPEMIADFILKQLMGHL